MSNSTPAAPQSNQPPEIKPLSGSKLVMGTIALSLATFMNVLDTSIANVSIPAISGDLGVSPSQGTWVITSFAVANAIALPLTGWLSQRIGQVKLFTISVVLFVIASWLCGLAPNIGMLIAFRVLQGAVAGPMIPLSQTLLLSSYPKAKAGTALAMWGITTLVAPVMGPLLGGWISDNISWPWIFYINIPIGIGAAAATWSIYRERESQTRILPIDRMGLFLLIVWVGSLQVMLDKGKELDWFTSPTVVILGVIALIGFAFFLVWELTAEHPVVDLRLLQRRNFWTGALATSLGYGTFFGNVVLLPLWLQQYMGLYRHARRPGHCASRYSGHRVLAHCRQEGRNDRSAQAGNDCVSGICVGAVDAIALQYASGFQYNPIASVYSRHRNGIFLHTACIPDAFRPDAGSHSCGFRFIQLLANHGRCIRHIDCNDALGRSGSAASRSFGREHQCG